MTDKRHTYIKQAVLNKSRFRRWRKLLLCLSCVVVFCTVYALVLPAITLESTDYSNTTEHVHNDDCYSNKGEIVCTGSDVSSENERIDYVSESESNFADSVDNESSYMQEVENQDVEPETFSINQNGYDLSSSEAFSKVESIALSYQDEKGIWHNIASDNTDIISPDKLFKFTVNYIDIQIQNLLTNYNCTLKYTLPDILRDAYVDGSIMSGTANVGTMHVSDGIVYVQFNEKYRRCKIG